MRRRPRPNDPVFFDPQNKRGPRLRIAAVSLGVLVTLWSAAFAVGVMFVDILPPNAQFAEIDRAASSPGLSAESTPVPNACAGEMMTPRDVLASGAPLSAAIYLRVWPDQALATLASHCGQVKRVIAEWLTIDADRQTVEWLGEIGAEDALRDLRRLSPGVQVGLASMLPLPSIGPTGETALDDPAARARIAAALTTKLADGQFSTLCVYPYGYESEHRAGLRALLTDIDAALGPGTQFCLVAEAESSLWRDQLLTGAVDEVILQGFLDPGALPMPLAPQAWFSDLVAKTEQVIGPEKLNLALGSMAVQWVEGVPEPTILPFAEAMRLASRNAAAVTVDPVSLNTHLTYVQGDGRRVEIWMLDAASLHNQLRVVAGARTSTITLWAAGFEDPGAWALLQPGATLHAEADAPATITFPDYVGYEGDGPFLRTIEQAREGHRQFYRDPVTGLITGQIYDPVPRPFTIERYGSLDQKLVALTFDDGPDEEYTAALLDALAAEKVPATFFVVGTNVMQHPDLARRMVEEGHEVGSHTFFHPVDRDLGPQRLQIELNALQRLLASVTGRSTYLFRMPYGRSEGPLVEAEVLPQLLTEREGYLVAGADAVPRDWEGLTGPEIADFVVAEVTSGRGGQVVVMHDAGGDRANTVTAVPILIARLRAQGYEFVGLSRFLGLTRDQVMPLAQNRSIFLDGAAFLVLSGLGALLFWVFWGLIGVGVLRALAVLVLALSRRPHRLDGAAPSLPVTVVVPAFNESLVIVDSIRAVLASDHPDVIVIVVDDGSTDDTAQRVEAAFEADRRVRLIQQSNTGKWAALNAAYQMIDTEVVVAVDADALLAPDAIGLLVRHFADPKVGAVAGNVTVGNRGHWLARLQALEYITAQNIDRRAAERIWGMLVVPGCIGAWRTEAVRKVGLYSGDTITEDADLTVSITRAGYRTVFEERAFSVTEVPETIPPFLKQRLRWTFGMMQIAWKHRRAARTARGIGMLSIPDLWLTGVLMGLVAPLADLFFLGVILHAASNLALGMPVANQNVTAAMIAGWVALPGLDLVAAILAFSFQRNESRWLLLLLPLQRLVYRPLIYVTVYRAVGRALAGRLASWGKLVRHGILGPQVR
jgi:peptidoglycan/xylan/chitin deacetylase (PgdA/CDA1 family)